MANGLDEFNLQLSGELDQKQSISNVNSDLATIERAIEHLKVQAEIDPNSVKNIAKQLSDILNQKVVVDNIQIDASKVTKTAQQVGQKIGDTVEKSVQQSLSIDDVIDKQVTDLMTKYSIAGKKGSKAFEEIRQAVVNYRKELASASDFDPDDEFSFFANSADIRKVTSALADHMKVADATKDTYASLAEYIKHVNNSGTKIHLPESIRQEYGNDFSSMRSQLGKAFTTGHGGDFESFITELNGQLGNVIDMSQGAEAAFGDLVQKVNSAKGGNFLSGDELFKQGYLDRNEIERDITSAIDIIEEEEKKLAQTSTSVANTVVQNEQKKQQAHEGTAEKVEEEIQRSERLAKAQTKLKESYDQISKNYDVSKITFGNNIDADKDAHDYFKKLLKDEEAVIYTTSKLGELGGLKEFTTHIKRASGELESLRFILDDDPESDNGRFRFLESTLNDKGYLQQVEQIEKTYTNYLTKLNDLKTKYSEASIDYSGFETVLKNFREGTVDVNNLKLAFNELSNSAKLGVQSLKSQDSSFDPIQQALNNMRDMPSMLKTLEASMSGVKDKTSLAGISVKDLTSKYEELQKEMTANGGKVPLTDQWTQNYRELMSTVTSATKQVDALKKAEASDNSQTTKQANYYSSILASYRQMYDIKKKLLSAGEEEAKVLESQRKSLSASIASNYKQLGKQGLTDKDWQSQVDTLKKEQEYQLNLTQARISDKNAIQEQTQAQRDYANALKEQESLQKNLDKIQHLWGDGSYEAKYDSLIAKTNQWRNANDESVISTEKLTKAYNEFNTAASNFAKDGSVKNRDILIQKEEELGRQLKATTNDIKIQNAEWAKTSKVDSLHQKIQEFYDKNTATHRRWGGQLKNMLNETAHGAQVTASRINEIEQEYLGVVNAARQAGKLGDSFFGGLKNQASKFISWFSMTSVIMEGVQSIKKMVTEVKTLDNAMMDLTMATGYNRTQVEALMDTYFKLGDKLSATASDVAASADTWLRQGKSIAETNKLIEDSMVLSKIGGLSSEDSTKYLTSVMKGYKVATEDVIGVVDKLSAVDMASATDVGGLAEGMSEVAASADLAGVSMDKLLGYLATIGEVTQSGMGEVGTTLNAVFARMGNIKLSRLKDYDNNGEDLSNVETVLRGVGITLRDSMNSFRDFDEVLDETASNWNNYSEVQQRAIAQAFSGTHHMNEFIILMENYDTALKYTETSLGSTGQAMEKFEAYEESIAGHTEKFKNAFQDLSNSVVDSGLINFFIDLGTTGIKAVDGLVDALGGLGTIGLIGGGLLSKSGIG